MAQVNFQPDLSDLQIPITVVKNTIVISTGAGSRVQCSSVPQFTRGCTIKMKRSNATLAYVGGATVNNVNGYELAPGESVQLGVNDLSLVWIWFDGSADSACVLFGQ